MNSIDSLYPTTTFNDLKLLATPLLNDLMILREFVSIYLEDYRKQQQRLFQHLKEAMKTMLSPLLVRHQVVYVLQASVVETDHLDAESDDAVLTKVFFSLSLSPINIHKHTHTLSLSLSDYTFSL